MDGKPRLIRSSGVVRSNIGRIHKFRGRLSRWHRRLPQLRNALADRATMPRTTLVSRIAAP